MILLDTHVWLWLNSAVEKIPREILRTITEEQTVYLSAATAWEMSIKYATGKLKLPVPPEDYIPSRMEANVLRLFPSAMSMQFWRQRFPCTIETRSTVC